MQHVLVVEDEPRISDVLVKYLNHAQFSTDTLDNGTEVGEWVKNNSTDMILLDLMLPGKDGIDVCKEVRSFSQTPIIMVTARAEEIDRLLGLELGADDYICKPFSPREVVARVRAVLRRQQALASKDTSKEVIALDKNLMLATVYGNKLDLTAVEFQLLSLLVKEPGRVFTRNQLIDKLYSDHRVVSDRTIDSHIKKLRKKIHQTDENVELIHSVYGVGYKYEMQ